jgi:hypothetical protein
MLDLGREWGWRGSVMEWRVMEWVGDGVGGDGVGR